MTRPQAHRPGRWALARRRYTVLGEPYTAGQIAGCVLAAIGIVGIVWLCAVTYLVALS